MNTALISTESPVIETPCATIAEGVVTFVKKKGRNWGFIKSNGLEVFWHFKDVSPDRVGRRRLVVGAHVSFTMIEIENRYRALNIVNISQELSHIDVATYREWSTVKCFNFHSLYILERTTGDELFLAVSEIPDYDHVRGCLGIGAVVSHGVRQSGIEWTATDAKVVSAPPTPLPIPAIEPASWEQEMAITNKLHDDDAD